MDFMTRCEGAAYYELAGQNFEKNPRYPDVPALKKNTCPRGLADLCGSPKALYDYIGDETIARLLNHPEEYSNFFKRE